MKCDKCPHDRNVKKIAGIGKLCYKCFDKMIMNMLAFQEDWLHGDVIPTIQLEIANNIALHEDFTITDYIKDSIYEVDIIRGALFDMLDEGGLPEIVRSTISEYLKIDEEIEDGED